MKRNITRGFKKALALGMAALMVYLPVYTAIPEAAVGTPAAREVSAAAKQTASDMNVPIELDAEATLTNVTVNNAAETGITYDATSKKIVIPKGTEETAEIDVTLEFTLPITKKADGATPIKTITDAGTTVIKYSYSYQAGSVGDLLKLTDVKLTPGINVGDALKGDVEFFDENMRQINNTADVLKRVDITYLNDDWKADTDGFQYYRSPSSDYTGAEIKISPKRGYQFGGSSLKTADVIKNEDGSVVLKVKNDEKLTIIIKPIPVDMPENALEWTDEFETGYNSKGRTVEVSLTPTKEEAAKDYTLKWARKAEPTQMIEYLTWYEVSKNSDGKYTFEVNYDANEGEQTYIIYRYSNGVSKSGAIWNANPVKFDIVNPSLAKCWVEVNGEKVWEESSGATQPLAWINKQKSQCVIRLQGEDNQSGVEKAVYSIYDGTGTVIQSYVERVADANGVCSISYTEDIQGDITNFPIRLEYEIYDRAGNTTGVQTKILSDMIGFDCTSPELSVGYTNTSGQSITNLNQWQTEDVLVTISATDPAGAAYEKISGIDRLQIIDTVSGVAKDITADAVRRPDGTYQLTISKEAVHQLSIAAYDKAGNISKETKAEVKLDKSGIQNARVTLSTVSRDADASQFADPFTVYAQAEAFSGIREMIFYVYEKGTNRLLKEQSVTDFQMTGNLAEASFHYVPSADEENGYVVVRFMDRAAKSVTESSPHVVYSQQKPYAFKKQTPPVPKQGNVKIPLDKQKDNFAGGEIKSSVEEVMRAVLTDADKTAIAAGKDADIWVEIRDCSSSVSEADKIAITANLPKKYVVGTYLDINLWKQITGNEATKVTQTPNGAVKIGFTIPESLQKSGRTYKIIRLHNGVATVLDVSVDANYGLTFETDQFSTYALVYADAGKKSDTRKKTDTGKKKESSTEDSKRATAAETGDLFNPVLWMVILMISVSGAAAILVRNRKKDLE